MEKLDALDPGFQAPGVKTDFCLMGNLPVGLTRRSQDMDNESWVTSN